MTQLSKTRKATGQLTNGTFKLDMGYSLPAGAAYEDWEAQGEMLFEMHQKSPFLIGDWSLAGEDRFGEMAAQVLDDRKIEYGTLANYRWVAKSVPLSRRRERLTFGHHQVVAPLDPDQQEEMLDLAEAQNWSVKHLRKAVKAMGAFVGSEPEEGTVLEIKCPHCNGTGYIKPPEDVSA